MTHPPISSLRCFPGPSGFVAVGYRHEVEAAKRFIGLDLREISMNVFSSPSPLHVGVFHSGHTPASSVSRKDLQSLL